MELAGQPPGTGHKVPAREYQRRDRGGDHRGYSVPMNVDVCPCLPPEGPPYRDRGSSSQMEHVMTTTTAHRPSIATRRIGYISGALAGVIGLLLVNVWPGWDSVPFLTSETTEVLGLVNASFVAGIVANVVYLMNDAPWLVALGGVVTTGIGLVALIGIIQVFPVDFSDWDFDGTALVQVLLILAIVGTTIGIVVQLVALVRSLAGAGPDERGQISR